MRVVFVSGCALIDAQGRVLIAKRPQTKPMAGLWEFPGGKIESGESPESALIRELREELAIDADASSLSPLTFTSHDYDDFHLLMVLYECRKWGGEIKAVEGQTLRWVEPIRLYDHPMPSANPPLLPRLVSLLKPR
ncbi:MAG: (deoxy)nucleoside triphosphate pyrophosphohydrolase [Hyphomicrobiales bacterium]